MNAWRACVRLWAFGSAAWLAFWAWDASQCISAARGMLLCPTMNGEGLTPMSYWRMGLTILGPPVVTAAAGLLLWWWAMRDAKEPGAPV